jgi:hypothetical protein
MPSYLRNFLLTFDLWPTLNSKNPGLKGFSIASIEDDIRGIMISDWQQNVVNKKLAQHNALLSYHRASGKQILYFLTEEDQLIFKMKYNQGE